MKVGYIGLGNMGRNMALRLLERGVDLTVTDINPDAAKECLAAGAAWDADPAALAATCDLVISSLPGPPQVEQVALGPRGIIEGIRPGVLYIDMSTSSPTLIRRIDERFAEHGARAIDAPVSGGSSQSRAGTLTVLVGAEEELFARAEPVLTHLARELMHVGPLGAGSVAKLVHNCAGYAIQTCLAEVFTMGVKAGVEPLALWEAVRQGAGGRRRTFDALGDHFLPDYYDPPDFALRLAHKDVTLATELAREMKVPMPMANLALAELTSALNRGWEGRDSRVAMELQKERAGVTIKVDQAAIKAVVERDGK